MLDKLFNGQGRSTSRDHSKHAPGIDKTAAVPRKEDKVTTIIARKRQGEAVEDTVITEKCEYLTHFQMASLTLSDTIVIHQRT
jgi:hypothetical protein